MQSSEMFLLLLGASVLAFFLGRSRSVALAHISGGLNSLHSLPNYHGYFTAIWTALPALLVLIIWTTLENNVIIRLIFDALPEHLLPTDTSSTTLLANKISNLALGVLPRVGQPTEILAAAEQLLLYSEFSRWSMAAVVSCTALMGFSWGRSYLSTEFRARQPVESVTLYALFCCAVVAIFTTLGILLSVIFESLQFFKSVPVFDFMFGLEWSPQTAIRDDQVGSSGSFGAVPLFVGTLLVSAVAMCISVPVGLMSAIYLAEYAHRSTRTYAKPALEVLAGIPTVVYGFFAALTLGPYLRTIGESFDLSVSSESALAAGIVMGVMIIPFISSLADDVITAVPQAMRDGSLAMGATHSETVWRVVIPAALPGIVAGIMLAISRAIGETMIVVMASGLAANLTANPLESVTTVTVQIVTLLTGDQEFDSPKTLAAFALGLMLFIVTLILNVIALQVVKRFREQYE